MIPILEYSNTSIIDHRLWITHDLYDNIISNINNNILITRYYNLKILVTTVTNSIRTDESYIVYYIFTSNRNLKKKTRVVFKFHIVIALKKNIDKCVIHILSIVYRSTLLLLIIYLYRIISSNCSRRRWL